MATEATGLIQSIDRLIQFINDEDNRISSLEEGNTIDNDGYEVKSLEPIDIIIIKPIDIIINLSVLELSMVTTGFCRSLMILPLHSKVFKFIFRPKPRMVIDYSDCYAYRREGTPSSGSDDDSDEDDLVAYSYQLAYSYQRRVILSTWLIR